MTWKEITSASIQVTTQHLTGRTNKNTNALGWSSRCCGLKDIEIVRRLSKARKMLYRLSQPTRSIAMMFLSNSTAGSLRRVSCFVAPSSVVQFTSRHGVTSLKFWIFINTAVQTCSRFYYEVVDYRGMLIYTCILTYKYTCISTYTGCPRRNGQNFGRVFLMLNYTDITQNIYIPSWTVTEIMVI